MERLTSSHLAMLPILPRSLYLWTMSSPRTIRPSVSSMGSSGSVTSSPSLSRHRTK